MFAFLRARLCVFVATQFLMPRSAGAQSHQSSYARLLIFNEAREVRHGPWCAQPAFEGTTYFVRTAEGLNVPFPDVGIALNAVVLLNVMAHAQSHCDRNEYDLAFDEYAIVIGMGKQEPTQEWAQTEGVLGLLYPHHDLASLAEHVVPPFHACGGRCFAGAKGAGLRWSRR
jgi:hypothetical protein